MNTLIIALATLFVASAAPGGGWGLGGRSVALGGLGPGIAGPSALGATIVGPSVAHSAVVGPAWGAGLGLGAIGLGHAGHGVAVVGPPTIRTNGLWGPTIAHGQGGHW